MIVVIASGGVLFPLLPVWWALASVVALPYATFRLATGWTFHAPIAETGFLFRRRKIQASGNRNANPSGTHQVHATLAQVQPQQTQEPRVNVETV